jgi:hypothetical protein
MTYVLYDLSLVYRVRCHNYTLISIDILYYYKKLTYDTIRGNVYFLK